MALLRLGPIDVECLVLSAALVILDTADGSLSWLKLPGCGPVPIPSRPRVVLQGALQGCLDAPSTGYPPGEQEERFMVMHTSPQAHTRGLAANVEAIRWDSVAAGEAVQRICQEAALRCQRVMAKYAAMDISDADGHNPSGH